MLKAVCVYMGVVMLCSVRMGKNTSCKVKNQSASSSFLNQSGTGCFPHFNLFLWHVSSPYCSKSGSRYPADKCTTTNTFYPLDN